jgi:hypothetical protein
VPAADAGSDAGSGDEVGDSDGDSDGDADPASDADSDPESEGRGSSVAVPVSSDAGVGSSLHAERARLVATTTAAAPAQRRTPWARAGREVVGKVMLVTVVGRATRPFGYTPSATRGAR